MQRLPVLVTVAVQCFAVLVVSIRGFLGSVGSDSVAASLAPFRYFYFYKIIFFLIILVIGCSWCFS